MENFDPSENPVTNRTLLPKNIFLLLIVATSIIFYGTLAFFVFNYCDGTSGKWLVKPICYYKDGGVTTGEWLKGYIFSFPGTLIIETVIIGFLYWRIFIKNAGKVAQILLIGYLTIIRLLLFLYLIFGLRVYIAY